MGRRGPKPAPAAIKEQKGSSRRPIGKDPVEAESADDGSAKAKRVEAPSWLKKEGRAVWERIAPRLIGMNLLSQTDAETFARYCQNFARWFKMQQILDNEGEVYETETYGAGESERRSVLKRAHPAYLIADRLERQLTAAEANFGLNPAERQRIFAARAAAMAGGLPDLFGNQGKPAEKSAPGKKAPDAASARPKSAVGFLQ
ncbi:phage terminase small subunit P27 family [Mesorhizobium sp. SP-1A]|uniref:phage terminase small subunit P27 family n=1 Tax=Mesorhizobium sp. SP-1A TaxID=3077840 RepID=UPI0028F7015D|nr:phage terminase small subunit P27 family [Mesorhizobium sp. SP-1A]